MIIISQVLTKILYENFSLYSLKFYRVFKHREWHFALRDAVSVPFYGVAEGGGGGGWYRFSSCVNACVLCVLSTAVQYRYTEWVRFNHTTAVADWTDVWGRELYDHTLPTDFFDDENANIVDQPAMKETVQQLHEMLREGWRSAMPTTSPLDI